MAKSTTADRIAHDQLYEALWALENWAEDACYGLTVDVEEGARLAKDLVEKAKKHKESQSA